MFGFYYEVAFLRTHLIVEIVISYIQVKRVEDYTNTTHITYNKVRD